MAIVGAEGPPKNQLQARWGGASPRARAPAVPSRENFCAYASLLERENAFAWLEKDLKIFGFFRLFCECAPLRPTSGA